MFKISANSTNYLHICICKCVCHWSIASSLSDCSKPCQTYSRMLSQLINVRNSVSHTHTAEWQTIAPDIWPPNYQTIWSVIQFDAAGNIQRVHYKSMKSDVSFSLGSVSMLFRWGGHFCHVCVKHFFLLTIVQKL